MTETTHLSADEATALIGKFADAVTEFAQYMASSPAGTHESNSLDAYRRAETVALVRSELLVALLAAAAPAPLTDSAVTPLTRQQAAIIGAYTGTFCGPFIDVHRTMRDIVGRVVYTHEMQDPAVNAEVRTAVHPHFLLICAPATQLPKAR
jgi:hypothetical protein